MLANVAAPRRRAACGARVGCRGGRKTTAKPSLRRQGSSMAADGRAFVARLSWSPRQAVKRHEAIFSKSIIAFPRATCLE
jgi:hypothetical protein